MSVVENLIERPKAFLAFASVAFVVGTSAAYLAKDNFQTANGCVAKDGIGSFVIRVLSADPRYITGWVENKGCGLGYTPK